MEIETYAKYIHFYAESVPPLLDRLTIARGSTVLDLGCGDGALLAALEAQGRLSGSRVLAVDLSSNRIERVRRMNPRFETFVSSAESIPAIPDGSVNLLISTQVIEHVPDDGKMLTEMARVTLPGAQVYLSTVFKKWYGWYFHRCHGKWALDPTHLREYGAESELVPRIRQAGFKILKQEKRLFWYPLMDPILKRMGAGHRIYSNGLLRALRKLRVPILGYYNWEFIVERQP